MLPLNKYFVRYKSTIIVENALKSHQVNQLYLSTLNKTSYSFKINDVKPLQLNQNRVFNNTFVIKTDHPLSQNQLNLLKNDANILDVSKVNQLKIDFVPNDSLYQHQWGARKIGAENAWKTTQGSEKIKIAIIDTGIDYLHPDLRGQFWVNDPEDINNNGIIDKGDLNGIDDDGNGFIDDVSGWDFTDRSGFPFDQGNNDYLDWDYNPIDENGHGTSVAGIIGAISNNKIGISGIAPGCKLMNLRAFDPSGYGEEDDVASAILYAIANGAKIINMSFGDASFSFVLRDVIEYAYKQGVILVGSSGNSSSDSPHYPSSYNEVISVGASTEDDYVASFSNYGSTLDLVAPGLGIITTAKNNDYELIAGTSAATPFVSASVGLLLSIKNLSNKDIKQILKTTCDDINSPGWDYRSGAGRLNLERLIKSSFPSAIEFNYPKQDFTTNKDSIEVRATILSPYFKSFSLFLGTGLNPTEWQSVKENQIYQTSNKKIATIDLKNLPDTIYTLRLTTTLTNGTTLEEMENITLDHTPPSLELININQAYYGDKSTIFASVYTDDNSILKLYYREEGKTDFNFVTLDGFATNNKFVKQLHWGFIPKNIIKQNVVYEIYLVAENLAGLKTIKYSPSQPEKLKTDSEINPIYSKKLDYKLSAGRLFKNPVNITLQNNSEILKNDVSNPKYSHIYKFNGSGFTKIDSIYSRIPKSSGDFNKNGKTDILSLFVRNGFIDEQINPNSSSFDNKFSDSTGSFWPIFAKDIDEDSNTEIVAITDETKLTIWEVNDDMTLNLEATLENYTPIRLFGNQFDSPNAVYSRIIDNGKNQIWILDRDGDLISYFVNGPNSYENGTYFSTDFSGENNNLSAGDYDGDGKNEIGIFLDSVSDLDIAPFKLLYILKYDINEFSIIYSRAFIDPSTEFNSGFQKAESSFRFSDLTNDKSDEAIIFSFPYSYILKQDKLVFYNEGVNSSQIFIGDLNGNNMKELALPKSDRIDFYEFGDSGRIPRPYFTDYFSIDSNSAILRWHKTSLKTKILLKSYNSESFSHLITTGEDSLVVKSLENEKTYYFKLIALNNLDEESDSSNTISLFVHPSPNIVEVKESTDKNLIVSFNGRIKNKIDNLQDFELISVTENFTPNSVTKLDENSYLLTFKNVFVPGNYKLSISNLRDGYNSPIKTQVFAFRINGSIVDSEFYIKSFDLLNNNTVALYFNLPIDEISAQNPSNYTFQPQNKINHIAIDNKKNSVLISTDRPMGSIGMEYYLDLDSIYSSKETGFIKINTGAGSVISLSQNAKNLNEVYVYPQPVSLSKNKKITFANATKRTRVVIFTLEGKKIIDLTQQNGDGGVDWDLMDINGRLISSGIYIYQIYSLNDSNEEKSSKTGKIAVIK